MRIKALLAGTVLAATLVSIHNIHMLEELMHTMRQAILEGRFHQFFEQFITNQERKS